MQRQIYIQRCVDYGGIGLVAKSTIDSEVIVVDKNGNRVEQVIHNGQEYLPCNIGDTIITTYTKKKYSTNFKVVGIDRSEQFYICEIVFSLEENIEMQLIELKNMVDKGSITVNKAHLKADDLLLSLLYEKGYNRIADAFTTLPKFYD